MKPITDNLGYCVLAKIRVADIIEVDNNLNRSEWQKYFNKISKKHIDFALCDPSNLRIKFLIELDDKSHENKSTKERDDFIEKVYKKAGYELIRIKNIEEFKNCSQIKYRPTHY